MTKFRNDQDRANAEACRQVDDLGHPEPEITTRKAARQKRLDHRLSVQAYATAIDAFRTNHIHRFLHLDYAFSQSDDAWMPGLTSETAADLFEEMLAEHLGTTEDATVSDATIAVLTRLQAAHQEEIN